MKSIIAILAMLSSLQAFAYSHDDIIGIFEGGNYQEKTYAEAEAELSPAKQKLVTKNLNRAAEKLSKAWSETVLKGPYAQLGPAAINTEFTRALYYKNQFIGFVGYIQADAAYVKSCEANDTVCAEEVKKELEKCSTSYCGVIYETFLADKNGQQVQNYVVTAPEYEN